MAAARKLELPILWASDSPANLSPVKQAGLHVDFSNPAAAVRKICSQVRNHLPRCVIAPDEKFVGIASLVSEALNLEHNSPDALRRATDKFLARQTLSQAQLPIPAFRLVDIPGASTDRNLTELEYPCVAKPLTLSGSRGVIRADNAKQLDSAIKRIRNLLASEFADGLTQQIIVEKYVGGSEHAFEGYLEQGELECICIFDKPEPLVGPYFEETYYITPSRLEHHQQSAVARVLQQACAALGLTTGPIHAEVRIQAQQVWILEVAPRSIGGDCGHLFKIATDVSLEECLLRRHSGAQTELLQIQDAAGVLMIPVAESGILRRIEGVTHAQAVNHIREIRIDVREGERMTKWPEGGKYPGFIFAQGKTPETVEAALREAHSHLKFVCLPDLPVRSA